eukprot:393020_1
MSTQKERTELLAFGYVNKVYNGSIPTQLIALIQLFYNDWIYWILKDEQLNQFRNAQPDQEIISPKSFNIKGIQFVSFSFPNGFEGECDGLVLIGIKIKYLPPNVEYCEFYQEIEFDHETLFRSASIKQLYTHKAITPEQFFCDPIYQLSELKNMKSICFNCRANITHIKYKNNCNLKDYCMPINTIQKRFKFTWYITSLLINKCYNMGWQQPIYSHNFDNNNWCLVLFPDGYYSKGRSEMFLKCLYMPYNVNSMQVKFTFDINGKSIEITYNFDHHKNANGKHFMPFSQFKQESSLSVSLTLQIIKVFDKNNVIIEQNDWGKFGINPMIQIENIQSGILL